MAVETNIRIVTPGTGLYIQARLAKIIGTGVTPDLLEKACGSLRYRYSLAAIPYAASTSDGDPNGTTNPNEPTLLVATKFPVQNVRLTEQEWELNVVDAGQETRRITLGSAYGRVAIPRLVERALLATLASRRELWTLGSWRIWYEPEPIHSERGIDAFRRYEVSSMLVDGAGVGVAVDIGTAFFTSDSLDYYFDPNVPPGERRRRREIFDLLTLRQTRQKGTLVYDNGQSKLICYFADAPQGVTCATTGVVRAKGKSYPSLADYYYEVYPNLDFNEHGPAILVSFRGIDRPVWVAAERLHARIMNSELPPGLRNIDKLVPTQRRNLSSAFWNKLGNRPFGWVAPGVQSGFWRPPSERVHKFAIPELTFGKGRRLTPPTTRTPESYHHHFRQRERYLANAGCYSIPPVMDRTIYFAHPTMVEPEACAYMACDLTEELHKLTGVRFDYSIVGYANLPEAIAELKAAGTSGTAVFILDRDPATYYEAALQLNGWRIKRVMESTLRQRYGNLQHGASNGRATGPLDLDKGRKRWFDFVGKNVFEVLQLLNIVPYRLPQAGPYEAQLVVDVGNKRRYFGLSLLLARPAGAVPDFSIVTDTWTKADHQTEEINHEALASRITGLFARLPQRVDPIKSLLIVRDGRFCGQEIEGVDAALDALRAGGKLTQDARIDLVDLHKDSLKAVRIWEVEQRGDHESVNNPLEGTGVELDLHTMVVASTGAGTLTQGTAEPFWIVGNGRCASVLDAAIASFEAAQLNWSSPSTAQKLQLPLKRVDDELTARAEQEVGRLR